MKHCIAKRILPVRKATSMFVAKLKTVLVIRFILLPVPTILIAVIKRLLDVHTIVAVQLEKKSSTSMECDAKEIIELRSSCFDNTTNSKRVS